MKKYDVDTIFISCITENKDDFYRLAYSYVKNQEDALDIVQESIRKALTSLINIKDINAMKSWFYKIVIRTAIDFLRKQKKLTLADDETIDFLSKGKEDTYKDLDLHKALDELPIMYKTVIILRYFEDLKLEEIAEILEENINTVKTRLYKGLKLLRITITEEELVNE
ncbi:sigma-70 family RNA polymerase sigma factor [Caldibacillus lycopersici]|uniref:Sigma-70 family RNA polymerase sigma factor n=1 Tax=Perspicuibacillus lycopersici TaxID=1325689 RepID=A0AAE3IUF4_9BACI|nr:sigma-70 family RNA polymerase sigma factor [Perspicuibacillus lycopersici]MCU9613034.1 sigma-70 family RNA polymerase sigma factor [Perspicuibacillus lycopersici]